MVRFAVIAVGVLWVSSCSALAEGPYVSRPAPNSHVLLVPELQGATAGWCMATATETATEGSSGCGAPRTSTGPIFAEGGCQGNDTRLDTFVLTTSEVAAVSVAGGPPIPTHANSTLPDGLRAAAVEVLRNKGKPWPCPRVTPLAANGRPIRKRGKPGRPLLVTHCPVHGAGQNPRIHQPGPASSPQLSCRGKPSHIKAMWQRRSGPTVGCSAAHCSRV